jgi:hypothetical protein
MTTIGIIGSGNIGSALAHAFTQAGHDIVIANSRGPVSLAPLIAELGGSATAGTVADAAAPDLVVVTIPLGAVPSIDPELLAGTTIMDTGNYYPQRDGAIPELDDESLTTSEWTARHFEHSTIIKAFNHIPALDIAAHAEPAGSATRRALMVYGDHETPLDRVAALIDEIGFDAVPGGGLAESWRIQRDTPGYGPRFTAAELVDKLGEARRYRDM